MSDMPDARTELRALAHWACWLTVRRGNKDTKPPCNPNADYRLPLRERLADPINPVTWGTYEQARTISRHYHGIGFMFAESDPYTGIDDASDYRRADGSIDQSRADQAYNAASNYDFCQALPPNLLEQCEQDLETLGQVVLPSEPGVTGSK